MPVAVNSNEIIFECLKEHGKGELFFRADGLQFEARRLNARNRYLDSHTEVEPAYREAIVKAAITPGMTREQVTAAWGLLEEDTRTVFGNVVEDEHSAYGYFTGFNVCGGHALYFRDDVLFGVRQTDELIAPHERELDMRRAEENGFFYFYDGTDGQLRGSTADQYKMDWDTAHHRLYTIEIVPPISVLGIKNYIRSKGLTREYEAALARLGYDFKTAPPEIRLHVALSIIPYPRLRRGEVDVEEQLPAPKATAESLLPDVPIALPSSLARVDPAGLPPPEWIADVSEGLRQEVLFPAILGDVEIVRVEWMRERLFRVEEVPLTVNGVSLYDLVEAEWRDDDSRPYFKRVVENFGFRTIRAEVNDLDRLTDILGFARTYIKEPLRYRSEGNILVMTTRKTGLPDFAKELWSCQPVTWRYTDTLRQD